MKKTTTLLLLALGLSITTSGFAKVYKWTDANGKTHYTATPPPSKAKTLSTEEFKVRKTPKSSLTHTEKSTKYSKNNSTTPNKKNSTNKRQLAQAQCSKAIRKAPALEREIHKQLSRAVNSGKVPKAKLEEYKRQKSAGKFKAPTMSACIKDYMAGGSRHTDTIADNSAGDAITQIQIEQAFGF